MVLLSGAYLISFLASSAPSTSSSSSSICASDISGEFVTESSSFCSSLRSSSSSLSMLRWRLNLRLASSSYFFFSSFFVIALSYWKLFLARTSSDLVDMRLMVIFRFCKSLPRKFIGLPKLILRLVGELISGRPVLFMLLRCSADAASRSLLSALIYELATPPTKLFCID